MAAVSLRNRCGATILIGVCAAAAVSATALAADWRHWDAGALAFEAPAAMRSPALDAPTPQMIDVAAPNWTFTLTDDPARPDRGTTLTLQWSADVDIGAEPGRILSRAAAQFGRHAAERTEWRDAEMGWRGLDLVVPRAATNGAALRASCHAPETRWIGARAICDRIIAGLRPTAPPSPPTVAAPLPTPPKPAGLTMAPPAGPIAPPTVAAPLPSPPKPAGLTTPPRATPTAPPTAAAPLPTAAAPKAPPTVAAGAKAPATPEAPPRRHEVIFTGRLGADWIPFQSNGGDAKAFLASENGTVVADVPAGHGWARTGLRTTPERRLFLDGFGSDTRLEVTLRFDAAHNSAFGLALTVDGRACEGRVVQGVFFTFAPTGDGRTHRADWFDPAEVARGHHGVTTTRDRIGEVQVTVTEGHAVVRADTLPALEGDFVDALPGGPIDICVFAQAGTENGPASMALREIVVDRSPPVTPPRPAPGVAELPTTPVFGAGATIEWQPIGPSGVDLGRAVRLDGRGATVDAGTGGDGLVGIVSRTPFVDFDRFARAAPSRYVFDFDPARTTDFEIRLMTPPALDGRGQFLITGRESSAAAPRMVVGYCRPLDGVRRAFPAGWDGRFEIVLAGGRFLVGPSGGPRIGCTEGMFDRGHDHWMAVLAPIRPTGGGGFVLRSIVQTRIPPPGMSAIERPKFAHGPDFDVDGFIGDAVETLFGAPRGRTP